MLSIKKGLGIVLKHAWKMLEQAESSTYSYKNILRMNAFLYHEKLTNSKLKLIGPSGQIIFYTCSKMICGKNNANCVSETD